MNRGLPVRWTEEAISTAIKTLGLHTQLESALRELSETLGFGVSKDAIYKALKNSGHESAFYYLKKVPYTSPRPPQTETDIPIFIELGGQEERAPSVEYVRGPEPVTTAAELSALRQKEKIASLEAAKKRLLQDIADKENELANFKEIARPPRPIEAPPKKDAKQRKGVPVLLCSDWHVGEEVDSAKVNGLNFYNVDVAAQCIDRLADAFEWMLTDPRFDCRTAIVALMGDLMTGYLHQEQVESNLLSPQEEQVFLLDHIEAMLRKILAMTDLERIVVPCNSGNHGRATDKQRVSTRESNSNEQVVYQTLKRIFRDEPRIEFQIAQGEWLELDVMGYKICFTHGDSFQYGGGVGGISIPIRRGVSRQFQGRQIHQYCMGHFHTRQDFGDIQINGSMIGYSAYSQRIHAAFEKRQQSFFMIDSEEGKCVSAPIWL